MAEIKISDLSVGDWVRYDRGTTPYSIRSIYHGGGDNYCVVLNDSEFPEGVIAFACRLKPIPLTPEILEKNGFRLVVVNKKFEDWHDNNITIRKYYNEDNYHLFVCGQKIEFKILFIHQLQHALRLAGVEKEIEV